MPSEVMPDITLRRVTPGSGKGALGKWRAPYRNHGLDSEPGSSGNLNGCRAGGITMPPRGVCRRVLEPRAAWEGPLGKSCCCQPDSGNPTVRDERGAHGDVDYGGIRNPLLGSKERRSETLRLRLHAPCFYPTRPKSWGATSFDSSRSTRDRGLYALACAAPCSIYSVQTIPEQWAMNGCIPRHRTKNTTCGV
jgi:hypothetical protein